MLPPPPPLQAASGPRLSFEGGEQRCFRNLFVCGRDFDVPREFYGFGQSVVQQRQQAQGQAQTQQQQQQQESAPLQLSERRQDGQQEQQRRLRVRFIRRISLGRQLTNLPELVERCNSWRYRLPNSTVTLVADCGTVRGVGVGAVGEADGHLLLDDSMRRADRGWY